MILAWFAALALASSVLTEGQRKSRRRKSANLYEMPEYLRTEARRAWELFHEYATPDQLVDLDRRLSEGTADELLPPGWALSYDWLFYAHVNAQWARLQLLSDEVRPFFYMSDQEVHVVYTGIDQVVANQLSKKKTQCNQRMGLRLSRYAREDPPTTIRYYDIGPSWSTYKVKHPEGHFVDTMAFPWGPPFEVRTLDMRQLGREFIGNTYVLRHSNIGSHELIAPLPWGHPWMISWILMGAHVIDQNALTWKLSKGLSLGINSKLDEWGEKLSLPPWMSRPALVRAFGETVLLLQEGVRLLPKDLLTNQVPPLPGSFEAFDKLFGHLPNRGITAKYMNGQITLGDDPHADHRVPDFAWARHGYLGSTSPLPVLNLESLLPVRTP